MHHDDPPQDDWPQWYESQALDESQMSVAPLDHATSPSASPDEPRYHKLAILGTGGMGRVWLGWDTFIERHVALKEPVSHATALQIAHLRREVMITARLDHPGVVAVHDMVHVASTPMFVMALVRGKTLASHLEHATPAGPDASLIRHLLTICDVIAHAHACGIIHRDITPRNILLEEDGTCRIIDWGMAMTLEEARVPSGFAGTPGFMAPEQRVLGTLDTAVDIWGIGALLHTLLYGKPPGDHPIRDRSTPIAAICAKALHQDPTRRYESASAMREELLGWFEGRRVDAFETTPWRTTRQLLKRHRTAIALTATIAVMLAGTVTLGIWRTAREATRARRAERVALAHEARAEHARHIAVERAQLAQLANQRLLWSATNEALERGDVTGARAHWHKARGQHATPEFVGLTMRLGMIPELTPHHIKALFPCQGTRLLTPSPSLQLCRISPSAFQGWSTAGIEPVMLWQLDTQAHFTHELNTEIKTWRFTPDMRVIMRANHQGFLEVDLASGRLLSHRPLQGRFASDAQAHLLDASARGWLDFDHPSPCERDIIRAHHIDHAQIYLCKQGGVFAQYHDGTTERLHDGLSAEAHHYAYVPSTRSHWVSSSAGHLWPLHDFDRRVELGSPIRALTHIPSTDYILVRDWTSTWRVLDTLQGDWIASFGADVQDVRATTEGILQVIRGDMLELWTLPEARSIRRYRAEHGLADVAWSSDGSTLVAGDGGGYLHWFKPFLGERIEPLALGPGVLKSVTPLLDGGFAAIMTLDSLEGKGMTRVFEKPDGTLGHHELMPHPSHRILGRRVESLADGSLALLSVGKKLVMCAPREHDDTYVRTFSDQSRIPHYLDLDTDASRSHALIVGTEVLEFIGPADTLAAFDAPEGALYGAIASNGRFAVSTHEGIWIYTSDGRQQGHITTSSPVTSMDWRTNSDHLLTGHLDGSISVWHTAHGTELAHIRHHQGRVSSVASSPDGRYLATASWDTTVRILNLDVLDQESR